MNVLWRLGHDLDGPPPCLVLRRALNKPFGSTQFRLALRFCQEGEAHNLFKCVHCTEQIEYFVGLMALYEQAAGPTIHPIYPGTW